MGDVTRILAGIEQGDPGAAEKLLPLAHSIWTMRNVEHWQSGYDSALKCPHYSDAARNDTRTRFPRAVVHQHVNFEFNADIQHMQNSNAHLPAGPSVFATTHWSVVLTASDTDSPALEQALEQLCRTYWYPLYCFVRRHGHSPSDAEDLTQAFFTHLLERGALKRVTREKGRFRSFLLASLKYFLADEWDKGRALKRGGGCALVSLDAEGTEERYQRECSDELTAERLYERRWAMSVLDRAFVRLQEEFAAAGKVALHDELRQLQDDNATDGASYAEVAARLQMPLNTLKSHVHRFRQRYRELLCEEVSHTVAAPTDIAEEVRHLIAVVSADR